MSTRLLVRDPSRAPQLPHTQVARAAYDAPDWLVDAWISTYTAIRDGELDAVSDDVPRLLGRPAVSFADAVAPTT